MRTRERKRHAALRSKEEKDEGGDGEDGENGRVATTEGGGGTGSEIASPSV